MAHSERGMVLHCVSKDVEFLDSCRPFRDVADPVERYGFGAAVSSAKGYGGCCVGVTSCFDHGDDDLLKVPFKFHSDIDNGGDGVIGVAAIPCLGLPPMLRMKSESS